MRKEITCGILVSINSFVFLILALGYNSSSPVYAEGEPIASAGPDQMVNEMTEVTLNGTASSSPTGVPLIIYDWIQTDSNPPLSLNDNGTSLATFTAPEITGPTPSIYTLHLIVTDENGLVSTNPEDVTITVNDLGGDNSMVEPAIPSSSIPELDQKSLTESSRELQPPGQPIETSPPLLENPPIEKFQEPQQLGQLAERSIPPKLIETVPADGATEVSVTKPKVTAKFDKNINMESAIVLISDDNGKQIELNKDPQVKGTTLILLPKSLDEGTHYTVSIEGVKDEAGAQGSYKISFTTIGEPKSGKITEPGPLQTAQPSEDQPSSKSSDTSKGSENITTNEPVNTTKSEVQTSNNTAGVSVGSDEKSVPQTSGQNAGQTPSGGTSTKGLATTTSSKYLAKLTSDGVIEIPIMSFRWGGGAIPTGSGAGVPTTRFQYDKITMTRLMDQYSPVLFQKMIKTRMISPLEISTTTSDKQAPNLKYSFPGALIVGIKYSSIDNSFPVEEISLAYMGKSDCKGLDCPPTFQFNPGSTGPK